MELEKLERISARDKLRYGDESMCANDKYGNTFNLDEKGDYCFHPVYSNFKNIQDYLEAKDIMYEDVKMDEQKQRIVLFVGENGSDDSNNIFDILIPYCYRLEYITKELQKTSFYSTNCVEDEKGYTFEKILFKFEKIYDKDIYVYLKDLVDILKNTDKRVFVLMPCYKFIHQPSNSRRQRRIVPQAPSLGYVRRRPRRRPRRNEQYRHKEIRRTISMDALIHYNEYLDGNYQEEFPENSEHCQEGTNKKIYNLYVCEGTEENPFDPIQCSI